MMATSLLRRSHRRLVSLLFSLLFAVLLVGGSVGTAHAADGYRYWNYFHLEDGQWAFSQVGPADYELMDGAVEAYRFGTSATADGIPPRADLTKVTFDTVCEGTDAAAGEKRVAVLLDFGTTADADGVTPPDPRAGCALVDADANGLQVLQSVVDVRSQKGLTCALDGYPVKGCGDPVSDAPTATEEEPVAFDMPNADTTSDGSTQAASEEDGDNGLMWPLVGVGVLVVAVAGGGLALSRRNKSA